jgi:hypothetical protein
MISNVGFLFIEPRGAPSEPIIDDVTRSATELLRSASIGKRYRTRFKCTGSGCPARSDNADLWIGDGKRKTHSLIVHYVACHRAEIDLDVISWLLHRPGSFSFSEFEPTQYELTGVRTSERRVYRVMR